MQSPLIWFGEDAKMLPTGIILDSDGNPLFVSINSFIYIQPEYGTTPTASTTADTLTFLSSDGSVTITGDATTKSIDFVAVGGSGPGTDSGMALAVPCHSGVSVLDVVRIDATGTAQKAQADSATNAIIIGVVEAKPSSTTCNIRVSGVSASIFSSLNPTLDYFLSPTTAGGLVTTAPSGSGETIIRIGRPLSATKMVVSISTALRRA